MRILTEIEIIYVRGGDKTAPAIAEATGMKYGIRHDYTSYAPAVHMLDIDFHRYEQLPFAEKRAFWQVYRARVIELKPTIAMTADYFDFAGSGDLLNEQLHDLQILQVPRVMVCPKFPQAIDGIPDWCIVAVSVPAKSYAGFLPDYDHLKGRRVHLLGGKPELQADVARKILGAGGEIVSMDGSYHAMKAAKGQWWDGGRWVQLRRKRVSTTDLAIASGKNIVRYLRDACREKQRSFWEEV